MTILPELAQIPASPAAVGTVRTYGIGFLIYGLIIVVQGPARWGGPQYASATALAAPWVWGVVLASTGAVALIGSLCYWFALRNVGLYAGAVVIGFLGLTSLDVAFKVPTVSYGGGFFLLVVATAIAWVAPTREVRPDAGLPKV